MRMACELHLQDGWKLVLAFHGQHHSFNGMFGAAKTGFDAMMKGEGHVVAGWKNKIQAAVAHITPAPVLAEMHRQMAEPGSAKG